MKLMLLLLAAALMACSPAPQRVEKKVEPPPLTIRVMSYNVHHCRGTDNKVDPSRIAQVILEQKPDLVGIQEIDKGVERTARRDLPGEIAKLTGMHLFFEKNRDFQGGEYGNAILSRYPIVSRTNTHYKMLHKDEQRGLQQVVVEVKGRKVLLMNSHLDYRPPNEERLLNVVEIKEALNRYPGMPAFVTMDMNDYPNTQVHEGVKEKLSDVWEAVGEGEGITQTQPDGRRSRIDYVFYSKDAGIVPSKAWVVDSPASDHQAVVADFTIR